MKKSLVFAAFAALAIMFASCEKEDDNTISVTKGAYSTGVFVVNEGTSGVVSSISFFNISKDSVTNKLFSGVNSTDLGTFAQSISFIDSLYFITVTNSNKIEVVSQGSFKTKTTITGLLKPRYIQKISSTKAYVTEWGTDSYGDSLAVLNLSTFKVSKRIKVGVGADKMLVYNGFAYVGNKGGWGVDSTISVINTSTDTVIATIKVGVAPEGLVLDKNNKIWVLCYGGVYQADYSIKYTGSLQRINPSNNNVELSLKFDSKYSQPASIISSKGKDSILYTYNGGVYAMSVNAQTLPIAPKLSKNLYHINIDPVTGILYGTDPGNYTSDGYLFRFKAGSFAKIDSFKVGTGCGEILFNR
jgi:YVTN family beta-propeller protein